ncbi:MAG TPA: hypothetical protein VK864_15705, partial [Longimicrobiales bacterium]|nr:hypothetical protein [Longimicrobiales bacterium]
FPETGLSKLRYGTIVAAALAYLITTQGDAVGLLTMNDDALSYLPARSGRSHLRSLIAQLDRLTPGKQWQPARVIARAAELLKRRGVVLVISDFYDAEDATRRDLRRAAHRGHDVAMLQLISPPELTFPYHDQLEFQDLETGARRAIDARTIEQPYRAAINDFLERCRSLAHRDGVDYALMSTDTPPERALRGYLLRRGAPA